MQTKKLRLEKSWFGPEPSSGSQGCEIGRWGQIPQEDGSSVILPAFISVPLTAKIAKCSISLCSSQSSLCNSQTATHWRQKAKDGLSLSTGSNQKFCPVLWICACKGALLVYQALPSSKVPLVCLIATVWTKPFAQAQSSLCMSAPQVPWCDVLLPCALLRAWWNWEGIFISLFFDRGEKSCCISCLDSRWICYTTACFLPAFRLWPAHGLSGGREGENGLMMVILRQLMAVPTGSQRFLCRCLHLDGMGGIQSLSSCNSHSAEAVLLR